MKRQSEIEDSWQHLKENNTSKTDVAPWCYKWVDGLDGWMGISGWGYVLYRAPYGAKNLWTWPSSTDVIVPPPSLQYFKFQCQPGLLSVPFFNLFCHHLINIIVVTLPGNSFFSCISLSSYWFVGQVNTPVKEWKYVLILLKLSRAQAFCHLKYLRFWKVFIENVCESSVKNDPRAQKSSFQVKLAPTGSTLKSLLTNKQQSLFPNKNWFKNNFHLSVKQKQKFQIIFTLLPNCQNLILKLRQILQSGEWDGISLLTNKQQSAFFQTKI